MPTHEPLIYEYRGQVLDNVHLGYLSIVDEASNVLFHVGSPDEMVFYRSASKPIQALPVIVRRLDEEYGLTEEETALFSASHAGEPFHVAALESIFEKCGFREDMLVMKPTYPASAIAAFEARKKGHSPRKFFHNCSGKHAGAMLLQRALGGKIEDYWREDSLAQQEIRRVVMMMSETDDTTTASGIDGCGVPVFAVGMRKIAAGFKNLACPDGITDPEIRDAAERYLPRINRYPHMISGTGRLCSLMNRDPNIIAKGGAAGVYGCGLRNERLGIAFKVSSGMETCWPLILRSVLTQIGYANQNTIQMLKSLKDDSVYNDNERVVGHFESQIQIGKLR